MNSKMPNIIMLSFLEGLERFCYYGFRSILIFYFIDVLEIPRENAFEHFSTFILLISLLYLPAGLISDFFLQQKRGVLLGGVLATLGYGLLITEQLQLFIEGIILIIIGTSFTRLNLIVLIGRLFKKTDKQRDFGFLVSYVGINLGAFFGILYVGLISETYGHKYGFMVTAIAALVFTIVFYFYKNKLNLIEENRIDDFQKPRTKIEGVLDAEFAVGVVSEKKIYPKIIIPIVVMCGVLFGLTYDFGTENFLSKLGDYDEDVALFGYDLSKSLLQALGSFISIPIYFIMLIWYFNRSNSTWSLISLALFCGSIGTTILFFIREIPLSEDIYYTLLPLMLLEIGALIRGTIEISYITRLSNVRYSSSIVGGIFFVTALVYRAIEYFQELMESGTIFSWIFLGMAIISGVLILIFRKRLIVLSGGLD